MSRRSAEEEKKILGKGGTLERMVEENKEREVSMLLWGDKKFGEGASLTFSLSGGGKGH